MLKLLIAIVGRLTNNPGPLMLLVRRPTTANIEKGIMNDEPGYSFNIQYSLFNIHYSLGNINVFMHLQTQFPFRVVFDIIDQ
jgi:hypothetical protein